MTTLAELEAYYNDPRYWQGGLGKEGYTGAGYSDTGTFAFNNDRRASVILGLQPQSVLEVGCFLPGTRITCSDGSKLIEEIQPGEMVLSHSGHWRHVTRILSREYTGSVISIRPRYGLSQVMTPEHPILVRDINKRWSSWKGALGSIRWERAARVGRNMAVAIAMPKEQEALPHISLPFTKRRLFRQFLALLQDQEKITLDAMMERATGAGLPIQRSTASTYLIKAVRYGFLSRIGRGPTTGKPRIYQVHSKPAWLRTEIVLTPDLARLIGYYAGDGCGDERTTTGRISIVFAAHEQRFAEDALAIIQTHFGTGKLRQVGSVLLVEAYRRGLAKLFREFCGHGARNKRFPSWLLTAPNDYISEALKGLIRADGYTDDQRTGITTTSPHLASQAQLLLGRLGVIAGINPYLSKSSHIRGRPIPMSRGFQVRFTNATVLGQEHKGNRKYTFGWLADGFIWTPVRQAQCLSYTGKVFNLEVEEDHSYHAGFAVHNCAMGFVVQRLLAAGVPAAGVDISDFALSQAAPEVRPYLQKAWAWALPFPDQSFDVLFSSGALEHLPPELVEPTMREFARVARRGLLSITLSTDPTGAHEPGHESLHDRAWWRARLPENFDVVSDAQQSWQAMLSNAALIVAPQIKPVSSDNRYGGIERLVYYFCRGFRDLGWETHCVAARGSKLPAGVSFHESGPALEDYTEPGLLPTLHRMVQQAQPGPRTFLDFSHSKSLGNPLIWPPNGLYPWLAALYPIWHDPGIMQPPLPKHNIVCLSQWQLERLRRFQGKNGIVLDPHVCPPELYRPDGVPSDRCIYIGKLAPTKGALEAVRICREHKIKLDVLGAITPQDPADYVKAVLAECDGEDIKFYGEVDEQAKVSMLQRAKALLYPVSYPYGQGESHSHKSVEALCCGCPVIAFDQGALSEVITDGADGRLVWSAVEMAQAVREIESYDRVAIARRAAERWALPNVIQRWIAVMQEVARGERF